MATDSNTNNENLRPNDMNAFFDESANSGFKFKDLVYLILRNLPVFLICAAIGGLIAFYNVRGKERIYASSSSILIKTLANGGSESFRGSAPLNLISGPGLVVSTVNNEVMVLRSQKNMENMVRNLNLCTMYSFKTKVSRRNTDLYKDAPVTVSFPEMDENSSAAFSVKPLDQEYVLLDDFGENIPSMKVKLNDTVISPIGKLIVAPTWKYGDFINTAILVRHVPLRSVAGSYRGRISVSRDSERNALLRLSLSDTSPLRAADVLNMLMEVYNQESIDDQQRILDYTEKFINDRIDYLMDDIEEYQQYSVDFKKGHNIIDMGSYGQSYVAKSNSKTEEMQQLEAQKDMLRYLLNFI
ncbi:MAG: hypothetical protein IJT04_03730, partial [Bacteroidales bacterium]|nr:hypothetical protein [Bacteroidales bacterium]